MFADNRFGYLENVRFGLGYATTPVYWVSDIPTRVSLWIDDVFVSRTDLLEENEYLREELLVAQQELQLLESKGCVSHQGENPQVWRLEPLGKFILSMYGENRADSEPT